MENSTKSFVFRIFFNIYLKEGNTGILKIFINFRGGLYKHTLNFPIFRGAYTRILTVDHYLTMYHQQFPNSWFYKNCKNVKIPLERIYKDFWRKNLYNYFLKGFWHFCRFYKIKNMGIVDDTLLSDDLICLKDSFPHH